MALGIEVEIRNAQLDIIRDAIDAGDAGGKLKIYDGTRPSTGAEITGQFLLAICTFSAVSAADAFGGVLTFNNITEGVGLVESSAVWGRITDSDDNFVCDLDISALDGSGDLKMNILEIYVDGPVQIIEGSITAGNA